mgnify:FL=1
MTRTAAYFMAAVAAGVGMLRDARADWPTLHHDYQRSGYSSEQLDGPFERKWYRSFVEEMIGARVEAIVADGLCFVGTYAGNLYALRIGDGSTAWRAELDGAIGHSPCYHAGRLYVATDVGPDHPGRVVCLEARGGRLLWEYSADAGFWTAPACDGRRVYAGDRAGVLHAIDAADGRLAWTFATGAMILKPVSLSADASRIVLGSEDMHVYCLSPAGKLLWKSEKLPGLSLRDQAPTVWRDKVIVRTNPAWGFHPSLYAGRALLKRIQESIPVDPQTDQVIKRTDNCLWLVRTERRERAEHEEIVKFLRANPALRTWHTLQLGDGRQKWITSVLFTSGMHNPPSPPCFDPRTGELYTLMPTALSVYSSGVSQTGIGLGRIDPETGYLTNLAHALGAKEPGWWGGMAAITDETSTLGLIDGALLLTHQGAVGQVALADRRPRLLHGIRDTYGGLFGPGAAPGSWDVAKRLAAEGYVQYVVNEWHGPDRSMAALSDGRAFWVVGGCVVCFGGPAMPTTESGGKDAPKPWKWAYQPRLIGGNLTGSIGSADPNRPKRPLAVADIEKHLAEPPATVATPDWPGAATVRRRLDTAVIELIEGHPWSPWVVELGISGERCYYWRRSETLRTVAMALPHLSPATREKAVGYLDHIFAEGAPLDRPVWSDEGRRREWYDLSPQLIAAGGARPPKSDFELGDVYALWAYAHWAGRWDRIEPLAPRLAERFADALAGKAAVDPQRDGGEEVERLNADLAGMIALHRVFRHAGDTQAARRAAEAAAALAAERVHFERTDGRLLSGGPGHFKRLARYASLVPETAALLAEQAGPQLRDNLEALDRELHVWHQAWPERLVGGENYTCPPDLSWAIFLAMADGLNLPAEQIVRRLDQPWCRADLYFIDKLSATLRRGGAVRPTRPNRPLTSLSEVP